MSVLSRARLFVLLICASGPALAASGGVPVQLPHSGYLLDAQDAPVDGAIALDFRIFATATGGTAEWSAHCPAVAVQGGYFAVLLGSAGGGCAGTGADPVLDSNDLPASESRYLELDVAGVTLSPREHLSALPTATVAAVALDAKKLGGLAADTIFDTTNGRLLAAALPTNAARLDAPNSTFTGDVVASTFSGDGAGLTNLTLPSTLARLDAALASFSGTLKSQAYSTLGGKVAITEGGIVLGSGATYAGNGSGLTNLDLSAAFAYTDTKIAQGTTAGAVTTVTTTPTSCATSGALLYNTTDHTLRVCDAGVYRQVNASTGGAGGGAGVGYTTYRLTVSTINGGPGTILNEWRLKWDGAFQPNMMVDCSSGSIGGLSATITASSSNGGCGGGAWRTWGAFDGLSNTTNGWYATGVTSGAWIQVTLAQARTLTAYAISSDPTNASYTPASWLVQGSNDGTNWVSLDARSGQVGWAPAGEERTYYIAGTGDVPPANAYDRYRFRESALNGGPGTIVSEWNLRWDGAWQANAMTGCRAGTVGGVGARVYPTGTYNACGQTTWVPWQAFDSNLDNSFGWYHNGVTSGAALTLHLDVAKTLTGYRISSDPSNVSYTPRDWVVEGSNDGFGWTTVDSRVGQVFSGWNDQRTYYLSGQAPTVPAENYEYFRLRSASNNGSAGTIVGEWNLQWDNAWQANALTGCWSGTVGGLAAQVFVSGVYTNGCTPSAVWTPYRAFDNEFDGSYSWYHQSSTSGWITLHLAAPKRLQAYRISSDPSNPGYTPRDWVVEGSNDGASWNTIEARSNQVFTGWNEQHTYFIAGAGATLPPANRYEYFRIRNSTVNGSTGTIITEWQLHWDGAYQTNALSGCWSGTIGGLAAQVFTSGTYTNGCSGQVWTPWRAFDGTYASSYASYHQGSTAAWLAVRLATAKQLTGYKVSSDPTNAGYTPRDWVVEGSNDGVAWTTLDTRTNQTGWNAAGETRAFTISYP